jgi:hypothetical protein
VVPRVLATRNPPTATLKGDRTYNLGALIAFRLDANRKKGGICGGLIASRLLALHGVEPHILDLQFPVERLDLNSMIHHKFVSPSACLTNLMFEIIFFKKSTWKVAKTDRSVHFHAHLLFNLDCRNGFSLTEGELDAYMKDHPQPVHNEEATEESVQPSNIVEFPYQQPYYDIHHLFYLHRGQATTSPMMTHQHGACFRDDIDLYLGQKPKLGGRYADDSLIYISYFVGPLYIHVLLSLLLLFLFLLSKTQKDQTYFHCLPF